MIDKDSLWSHFIQVTRDAVGSDLSTMSEGGTPLPSIIRARDNGPTPDTHYISVDIVASAYRGHGNIAEYVGDDNLTKYMRLIDYLITFHCYGVNSDEILRKLSGWFSMESTLKAIRTATIGQITVINDPVSLPQKFSTEFIETSMISLVWSGVDTIVDTTSTIITTPTITTTFK